MYDTRPQQFVAVFRCGFLDRIDGIIAGNAPTGSEPQRPVGTSRDRRDFVDRELMARIETNFIIPFPVAVVSERANAVIAEPQARIRRFDNGEKEIRPPRIFPEVQLPQRIDPQVRRGP